MGVFESKIKIICPYCNCHYVVALSEMQENKFKYKDKLIYTKYFNCQECKNHNYVQIDDDETLVILQNCKKTILTQISRNANGRKGKQSGRINKLRTHLGKMRKALAIMLEGAEVDGKIFKSAMYEVFEVLPNEKNTT